MAKAQRTLLLLGADEPVGEALLRMMEEDSAGFTELIPVTLGEAEGCATWQGEDVPLLAIAELSNQFDWTRVDRVICTTPRASALRELMGYRGPLGGIPLEGGDTPSDYREALESCAEAIARVLIPLDRAQGVTAVSLFVTVPATVAGREGVEELAGQTRALFAMESRDAEVFPLQLAFNLIPQVGADAGLGASRHERAIRAGIRTRLDIPSLAVTTVWAPTFYGATVAVHGQCRTSVDLEKWRKALSRADGVVLMEASISSAVPTPATDALESDSVFVARTRVDEEDPHAFACWLVLDWAHILARRIVDDLLEG